jgi:hypothetical protein
MTKHECEIMKRLMDENEQLRARVKALEALTMPSPYQAPVYVPVPQIFPDVQPPLTPYWQRSPYRVDFGTKTWEPCFLRTENEFISNGSYS